jgi:carboxypeptidase family protein/TonB-dependent receptor-like protein
MTNQQFRSPALKFGFLGALAILVLSLAPAVFAQETTGSIKGVVVDPNGLAVANATVTQKNQQTGQTSSVTTTSEGIFSFAKLLPGKYTLTIETGSGFKKKTITDVDVKIGENSLGNLSLDVGSPTETVTVTGSEEQILNRDQSMISANFESRKVTELPSNAASFGLDTLALLVPGIAQNSGGGTNTNGTGLSVNGNRGRSNNFQIDGSDNNDLSVAGPNLFISNAEQVQEIQIVTNNYSAQYGRNLGSVVNYVTKSGGNTFHGSLFEYHLDERNFDSLTNRERAGCTTAPCYPPRFLSNTFGGSVGGPVYLPLFGEGSKGVWKGKDRAFFYVTYQGIRQPSTVDLLSGGLAINATDLPGLTAAFPGSPVIQNIARLNASVIGPGRVQPRSDLSSCNATTLRLAGAPSSQYALCNRDFIDFSNGATTQRVEGFLIERLAPFNFKQTDYSVRFDVKASNKDSLNFRYIFQDGNQQNDLIATNGFTGDLIFGTKNLGGSWTRQISSHMVNEFRTVRTRLAVDFGGGCDAATPGCVPGPSNIDNAQIENFNPSAVRGVTLTGNALRAAGAGTGLPQGRDTILYDFIDNLTWTKGRHVFIFGGEYKHTSAVVPFLPAYGGSYTFGILSGGTLAAQQARIFNNAPSAFSIALGNPNVAYVENDQYYFVQDDFKIRPNLTLNLGVRYEYTGQPIDSLTNFTLARENGATPLFNPALPVSARIVPKVAADKNNFAPRFGFAYSPKFEKGLMHRLVGTDATVIRGGFAIAYDPAFYNILLNIANSSPFSIALAATSAQLPSTSPLLPMPNSIFGAAVRNFVTTAGILPIGKLDPKWLTQTQVASNFRSPYSEQWSFGFQRQIGKNSVVEARYVGNHGVGLFQSVSRNPFVGIPGDPTLLLGSAGAASGFYGFSRNLIVNGATQKVTFPSFAGLIPAGVTGLICTDIAATPDNEAACNGRIRPQGSITDRENTATSSYHSLQTQYQGRFLNRSLNLGATYTFSKTIDTSSEVFAFNSENSILPQNPFNYNADRGLSALHRPHIFSFNAIYDVPAFKSQQGVVGHVLGGWQVNAVHVYNTGRLYSPSQLDNINFIGLNGSNYLSNNGESLRPFISNPTAPQTTVAISQIDAFLYGYIGNITDLNGFLSLNNLNNGGTVANSVISPTTVRFIYNGPGSAKILGTPYGNSPRYSLVGPPINQTNLGLFKNTRLFSEKHPVTLQLRFELFNAFNHPQPGYGITRNGSLPAVSLDSAGVQSGPFADNSFINLARRWIQFGARLTF